MTEQTNDRGEYTGADGKLYHQASVTLDGALDGIAIHEGEWLKCDGCNPMRVVHIPADAPWSDTVNTLVDLRREYADASAEAKAADERLSAAKDKLKTALSEASAGALRAELRVAGYRPVTLIYTEPWRLDTKRLQAEQPAVYVEYAKRGSQWTLAEVRGKA